jgi:hypothetical protein
MIPHATRQVKSSAERALEVLEIDETQGGVQFDHAALNQRFTKVPQSLLDDQRLTAPEIVTYIHLLSYAWSENQVFPGQDVLAEKMRVNVRSVKSYIAKLKEVGYLSIKRRGLGMTNVYILHIGAWGETQFPSEVKPTSPLEETPTSHKEDEVETDEVSEKELTSFVRKNASKSHFCPQSFVARPNDLNVGRQLALTDDEIELELATFRDYEFKTAHSDWHAALRNWLRRAAKNKREKSEPAWTKKDRKDLTIDDFRHEQFPKRAWAHATGRHIV